MAEGERNGIVGVPSWTNVAGFMTSGAQNTLYPITNLSTTEMAEPWRSPDLNPANTQFEFSFSDNTHPVSLIVLCRHNLSVAAQWRVTLWGDDLKTQLQYQSPLMSVWPSVFSPEDLEWEDDNFWDGIYYTDDIKGYPFYAPHLIDDWTSVKRGLIEIFDASNPDGFVQASMCEVANHWEFTYNYAPGAQTGFRARTKMQEAEGGARYFKRLPKPRVFVGQLRYLPREEVMSKAFEHLRIYDLDRPFFWWAEPSNLRDSARMSWLARHQDLGLLTFSVSTDYGDVPISFIEVQ